MKQFFLNLIVYPFHNAISCIIFKFDPIKGFFYWLDNVELKRKDKLNKLNK